MATTTKAPAAKSADIKTATDTRADAPVTNGQPAATDKPAEKPAELSSEKLVNLELQYHDAKMKKRQIGADVMTGKATEKDEEAAEQAAWSLNRQIIAEKLVLVQEAKNRQIAEKRNAVSAEVASFEDLVLKRQSSLDNDKMTLDEKNAINDSYHKVRDGIINRLNGGAPAKQSGTPSDKPAGNGTRGAVRNEIRSLIAPLFAEGKSGAEVRTFIKNYGDKGAWSYFNDGTANAAIREYEVELGLK